MFRVAGGQRCSWVPQRDRKAWVRSWCRTTPCWAPCNASGRRRIQTVWGILFSSAVKLNSLTVHDTNLVFGYPLRIQKTSICGYSGSCHFCRFSLNETGLSCSWCFMEVCCAVLAADEGRRCATWHDTWSMGSAKGLWPIGNQSAIIEVYIHLCKPCTSLAFFSTNICHHCKDITFRWAAEDHFRLEHQPLRDSRERRSSCFTAERSWCLW